MIRVEDIGPLFGDAAQKPLLNYRAYDLEVIQRDLDTTGFSIVRNLVPENLVQTLRSFWLEKFSSTKIHGRVTWSPYLGQANHFGFTKDPFQNLFRACDFLWNDPIHRETREVCLRIHALRNLAVKEDPYYGMRFTDARYGIFITASYYPAGRGHMKIHSDGVEGRAKLVHSLLPLTFRGRDYKEGGMMVENRAGHQVDVEGMLNPGDAVIYDGALKHGVMPIVPLPGSDVGRLQVFPIPTRLGNLEDDVAAIARVPAKKIIEARWLRIKNFVRIKLGMTPAMR